MKHQSNNDGISQNISLYSKWIAIKGSYKKKRNGIKRVKENYVLMINIFMKYEEHYKAN